jgi:hypoxanthine phosphoribosyltransferase
VWVVGYGLDFADRFRTLPYVAELKPQAYAK